MNYEIYNHRHSPVYLIFLSFLKKAGISFEYIRLIHLNISILLIYFFFKCLSLKFSDVDKTILLILSFSIFLSPTFRSLAIWPSSRLIGLLLFTISILEFLKYLKFKKKFTYGKILFLILSSYVSPNFSLFIFYFSYHYLKENDLKDFIPLYIFCLISSFPVFYYLIILDVNFLMVNTPGSISGENISLSFNFSNKILLISSIILFHLIPFLINRDFFKDIIKISNIDLLIVSLFFIFLVYFFDYQIYYTGGEFFQISNIFLKNNILFYIISFISLILIFFFQKNL